MAVLASLFRSSSSSSSSNHIRCLRRRLLLLLLWGYSLLPLSHVFHLHCLRPITLLGPQWLRSRALMRCGRSN